MVILAKGFVQSSVPRTNWNANSQMILSLDVKRSRFALIKRLMKMVTSAQTTSNIVQRIVRIMPLLARANQMHSDVRNLIPV